MVKYPRKDAIALRSRIEGEMREGSPDVSALLDQYLAELVLNGQASTARTYGSLLKPIRGVELTEANCRELQAARAHQSRNTVRTFTAGLISFCDWLVDLGYLYESPMRRVRMPRAAKGRNHGRFLRHDELQRVWAACEGDDRLLVLLLLTGLRAGELCSLRWADISGDSARIFGKGETVRHVYLDGDTRALLAQHKRDGLYVYGFTVKALEKRIARIGKRAGIRLWPHLFRHTMATHAKINGMEDSALQQLGGWANDDMIRRTYAVSAQQEAALDRAREVQLVRKMLSSDDVG